ncbi:hypothetical protein [Nioella sp. MMSF_3534]|uniref:hypothetical protein n=1 Tax=Nioella sp. MMSF_3534 TaxID=3046720 RepID=UPI00273FB26C|nr:hypothetical protein [Nioella sp. MMSF_3534]
MPRMPQSVLEAAATDDTPVARASTKYMEMFQPTRPALGGTDIKTFPNAAGSLDLYTVGTDNQIYRLRQGEGSLAPYEQKNLAITGRQIFAYTNDGVSSNTPNLMTLGANGQLHLATFRSQTDTYFQRETKPADATETIRQFTGARGLTGNIYFNVILEDNSTRPGILANNFYLPGEDSWAGPVWVAHEDANGNPVRAKSVVSTANNPIQSALFAIGEDDDPLYAKSSDRTARLVSLGTYKVSHMSVVTDPSGQNNSDRLNVFAIERDTGKLLLKKEKKYQTGSTTQWDDWIVVDPGQGVRLTSIFAAQQYDNLLQVFGIGDDGRLYWTGQLPGEGRSGTPEWQPILALGNEIPSNPADSASIFAVGRDSNRYSEAFTVSAAGNVTRFWQSPTTQQWFQQHIELERTDDDMTQVPTHSLELTVLDGSGLPLPNAQIGIKASSLVTLFVNGLSYRASQADWVSMKAGPDGKVIIQQQANALAAATLYIETPQTTPGSPIVVQPNLQLQEKLTGLTVDEIKDAKDAEGNFLLPAEYRTDEYAANLQAITQASMSIADADENGSGKVNYHFASLRAAGRGFRPALNLAAMEGQTWAIDFTSGFPTYEVMTADSLAEWKSGRRADMAAAGLGDGWLKSAWGTFWNGIKEGAEWIVDGIKKIVVEVVDGIGRVLFHIGEKVFEAVIEFAQQAFDFVQGIWNWLKVKLDELYQWLAFLFDLPDIVRTAEAIRHSIDVTLAFTVDGVESVKQTILAGIDTMKDSLKDTIDSFVDDLNEKGDPSYRTAADENELSDEDSHQMEHNPFINTYTENYENAQEQGQSVVSMASSTALSSSLDSLVEMLSNLADNFQFGDGKEAFDEAVNYFTAIGDDPANAMNLLLSGVVKVMESVALFALDFARGVIATLMDLIAEVIQSFRDFLFNEWEIPIFSQLYKFFTGKKLGIRLIDIPAYIIAVPTTLIYKLATGKAPFPDQAALDDYRAYYTVDWLKAQSGIGTPSTEVRIDASAEVWIRGISLSIYSAGMYGRMIVDPITATASALNTPIKQLSYASIVLRYITTAATTPWLLNVNMGPPTCGAGTKGFSANIWFSQLVFGPTRGLLIAYAMPASAGKAKVYTAEVTVSVWGAVNATMVIWNYVATDSADRNPENLMRSLFNIVPGQLCRFLATPDMQEPLYGIPILVEVLLIEVGYGSSVAVAVNQIGT